MGNDNGRLLEGQWMGFTLDTDLAWAKKRFAEKHGAEPAEVHRRGAVLLLGPIPENGDGRQRSLAARAEAAGEPMTAERARQLALAFAGEEDER